MKKMLSFAGAEPGAHFCTLSISVVVFAFFFFFHNKADHSILVVVKDSIGPFFFLLAQRANSPSSRVSLSLVGHRINDDIDIDDTTSTKTLLLEKEEEERDFQPAAAGEQDVITHDAALRPLNL
jgi:hypothetical protein